MVRYCLEPPTRLGGLACFSLSLAFFLTMGLGEKKARQVGLLGEQAKTGNNRLNKQKQFQNQLGWSSCFLATSRYKSDEGAIGL